MKYATWNLTFDADGYGTGPEESIVSQGFTAYAAWSNGEVADGATIMGYFTGEPQNLEPWNFLEISQQEAIEFAQAIDSTAYPLEDGQIVSIVDRFAE